MRSSRFTLVTVVTYARGIHTYIFLCTHTHTHTHTHLCVYVHTHTHTCMYVCVCIYIHICVCVCVCVCIAWLYTRKHTHTHMCIVYYLVYCVGRINIEEIVYYCARKQKREKTKKTSRFLYNITFILLFLLNIHRGGCSSSSSRSTSSMA
jgi:hypothetical protein